MESSSPVSFAPSAPSRNAEIWRGLIDALPVMAGFVPFALVLGAQATQKGLHAVEVPLLTGLNFGGGSEFAAIALWTSPPHVLLIAAITFLVNSRHLLMGAVLAPHLRNLPKRKALPALFLMCDEAWAMAMADIERRSRRGETPAFSLPYYLGAGVALYLTWVVFTLVGALVGPLIGDIEAWGLHLAFPAVILVLMRGMWKGIGRALPWLVSLMVATTTYLVAPGAWYVAAGALSGLGAAYLMSGKGAA